MRQRRPHPHHPHRTEWKRKVTGRRSPHGGEARASGAGAVILYGWHTVKAAFFISGASNWKKIRAPLRTVRRVGLVHQRGKAQS